MSVVVPSLNSQPCVERSLVTLSFPNVNEGLESINNFKCVVQCYGLNSY